MAQGDDEDENNPLAQVRRTVRDAAGVALNVSTNVATGGFLGYNPDQGFTANAGASNRIVSEFSGANDRREEAYNQRVVADQVAANKKLIDAQNEQARINDVRASSAARAIRRTASFSTSALGGLSPSDERDFLGL